MLALDKIINIRCMFKPIALVSLLMLLLLLSTISVMNMEQVKFNYSLKDIPIPSQQEYLMELISSVGIFISNLRWRCYHFLNPSNHDSKETFGFKTNNVAPTVDELKEFEHGIYDLVKSVKFQQHTNSNLQNTMKKSMREMKNSTEMYVSADKTANFYKVKPEKYQELLTKSINKDYKKASDEAVNKVNGKDKKVAEKLELDDRIYTLARQEAFITLKDHKDNFADNPKTRLLNPAKSEIGKVSKEILTKVVTTLRMKTNLNSWKNTPSVIDWFKNLQNKKKLSFIEFDVCDYYPSITKEVLVNALNYAKKFVKISNQDMDIILQTKSGLLFNNKQAWNKKGSESFDVTMGSWDGAEVCDIVGMYLLSQISDINLNIGLYRDDGLAVSALTPRQNELTKKKLCQIFKANGFNITIEANKKSVNFLDVNFNLETETFKPYMKPNQTPVYVHTESNHPPSILKNIPASVNRRLSSISSNEEVFKAAIPPFQEALKKSGHDFELKFNPQINEEKRKKGRKGRNITYFNPPYSKNDSLTLTLL